MVTMILNVMLELVTMEHRKLKTMFVVLAGLLLCVMVLTCSSRNISCRDALPNNNDDETLTSNSADYIFNCANIASIKLVRLLGSGIYKKTYLGEYGTGTKVAVKMLGTSPRKKIRDEHRLEMFMKEILFSQELKHHNILKLLGFCFRGNKFGSETLKDEGVIAVYEYGEEVHRNISFFKHLSLLQRLDIALAIIDLFLYLENSPLGSMGMIDIALRHFLWNNNTLKLIDLDGNWQEPSCQNNDNATCEFNLTCVDGRCVGYNAKSNLLKIKNLLLERLFRNVDMLALERNATARGSRHRQRGLDALNQLILVLNENPSAQEFTFTWVRKQLLDARSALS